MEVLQQFWFSVKPGIFYEFLKSSFFCLRWVKRETGTSDVISGHKPQGNQQRRRVVFFLVPVKTIFIPLTFVISVHLSQEMASNDFSPTTSSDSEVSEMEDYDLEVEGLPNSSSMASDEEGMQEAYADDPLADEEWLEMFERDRKEEEALRICFSLSLLL